MNKAILIILVLVLVGIGGYFLLKGNYQAPTQPLSPGPEKETASPSKESPTTAEVKNAEVKEIVVSGTEFSFSPATISVKAGERLKITFRNEGRAPHDLTIEGLNIGTKTIGSGQSDILEFTAPVSGTYTFFCSVAGHRVSGMEGSLKVE